MNFREIPWWETNIQQIVVIQRKCRKEEHQALYNSKMYLDYHNISMRLQKEDFRLLNFIATSLLAVTHQNVNWWTLNIYARMYAIDNTWIVYHTLKSSDARDVTKI